MTTRGFYIYSCFFHVFNKKIQYQFLLERMQPQYCTVLGSGGWHVYHYNQTTKLESQGTPARR